MPPELWHLEHEWKLYDELPATAYYAAASERMRPDAEHQIASAAETLEC